MTKPEGMPAWALPALSWLVSFYFMSGFCLNVGFPPDRTLLTGDALYVALWLFFLFLPFFSRIKIGNFLELERELQRTQAELRDFKNEIRNTVSVLSTNVNTIGSMTNQVNINIPGLAELQNARENVSAKAPPVAKEEAKELERELLANDEDTTLALARTRIEIERLLRLIVGKTVSLNALNDPKYMSLRQLFDLFLRSNESFGYLRQPFQYVSQVCNAAIHAQVVSPGQA